MIPRRLTGSKPNENSVLFIDSTRPSRRRTGTLVEISSAQLSALSRLFSSTVVRQLAMKGSSSAFVRLVRQSNVLSRDLKLPIVKDAFNAAFEILKTGGLRDEYIYKAALAHRVLMGTHSLRTACMLNEFRTGSSKADVAILNGTTTVYEIKSERDSLSRLQRQLMDYRKVFASVFVIAGENHVDAVLESTPGDVGVMSLSRRFQISTLRDAVNQPSRICPLAVFESLRTAEAAEIVAQAGLGKPDVPNTRLRTELRSLFKTLAPEAVHDGMLRTLKRTRNLQPLNGLVERLPISLHAAALSIPLRKSDHDRLVHAVNTPMKLAMGWA